MTEAKYTVCDTPLGEVHVAWTDRGIALLASRLPDSETFLDLARRQRGWTPSRCDERREVLTAALRGWVAGEGCSLPLDLGPLGPFASAVLAEARRIPRGETRTYAEIGRAIGKPQSARAVGNALARNPVPLLVPCHRVVRGDGVVGHYGDGGREWKERLLRLEGVDLAALRRRR